MSITREYPDEKRRPHHIILNIMASTYQISFKTRLKNSTAIQSLHDCLKKLNVKHWTYDFQNLVLTLRSELPDFKRIQNALQLAGYKCDFVKLENIGVV